MFSLRAMQWKGRISGKGFELRQSGPQGATELRDLQEETLSQGTGDHGYKGPNPVCRRGERLRRDLLVPVPART